MCEDCKMIIREFVDEYIPKAGDEDRLSRFEQFLKVDIDQLRLERDPEYERKWFCAKERTKSDEFDPDDFEIAHAVYCVLWGDCLRLKHLGELCLRGDTLVVFGKDDSTLSKRYHCIANFMPFPSPLFNVPKQQKCKDDLYQFHQKIVEYYNASDKEAFLENENNRAFFVARQSYSRIQDVPRRKKRERDLKKLVRNYFESFKSADDWVEKNFLTVLFTYDDDSHWSQPRWNWDKVKKNEETIQSFWNERARLMAEALCDKLDELEGK